MAKKVKKRAYKVWTPQDLKDLKKHSREKTSVSKIAKAMKRTEATVRMKAYQLGMSVGHRRRKAA
jgi:ribosomal protein L13E